MASELWLGTRLGETPEHALVDPERLTRHGVVFGATGSGKTGLCVCLLEELAIAGVPVLVIDPKGDLANLALKFHGPTAADILPWVDEGVARQAGLSAEAWAEEQAEKWSAGRARSQVSEERVSRLVDGVEVIVHTPGSRAGVMVDVLGSLGAPDPGTIDSPEAMADLAAGAISALLDLVGVRADRLKDPRHIVLTRVLETAWQAGETVDLERLILKLIDPPFEKVGVFPLDTFFPRGDRMSLAMQLNGLLASSGFDSWREGVPLDFDHLLAKIDGKNPVRVFCLAHLDESRRQFFAAMLLHRLVAWSRRQAGTSALRALLYIDEAFGYCPPLPAKPATREPILQLVKQARAVGLGLLMTSQNPVDIDYAVISNAGTWWLGRLATKQDQRRVLDGLPPEESKSLEDSLGGLGKWQFAIRPAGKPSWVMQTRFAISWLRGPMTLREIEQLEQAAEPGGAPQPSGAHPAAPPMPRDEPSEAASDSDDRYSPTMPITPDGYPVRWLDPKVAHSARFSEIVGEATEPRRADDKVVWEPALYSRVHMRFDERDFVSERSEDRLFYPITTHGGFAGFPGFEAGDLLSREPAPSVYAQIPETADEKHELKAFEKRIIDALMAGETDRMHQQRKLRLKSRGGEALEEFRGRVRAEAGRKADEEVAKLKERVDRKLASLEDKHRKAERDLDRLNADAQSRMGQELVNGAEMVFGMFFGGSRKTLSGAMTRRDQTRRAQARASEAEAKITDLAREIYDLETETERDITDIRNKWVRELEAIETKEVRLDKGDLRLTDFGIVWVPVSKDI